MTSTAGRLHWTFWVCGCLVVILSSVNADVELRWGTTAVIQCPLIADGTFSIVAIDSVYWFKLPNDDRALIGKHQGVISTDQNFPSGKYNLTADYSLVITNTTDSDGGTYRCHLKPENHGLVYDDVTSIVTGEPTAPPTAPTTIPPMTPPTIPSKDNRADVRSTATGNGTHPAIIAVICVLVLLIVLIVAAFILYKKRETWLPWSCRCRERLGHHVPIPLREDDMTEEFVNQLKTLYKQEMKSIPVHPTDLSKTKKSEDIFILPEMKLTNEKSKLLKSLDELINLLRDSGHVVVMGSAGGGRSTLMKKIAFDWACGKLAAFFKVVIVLRRKEIEGCSGVLNAIHRLLPTDTEITQRQLRDLIKKHKSEMLILLDASVLFGELSNSTGSPDGKEDWPLIDVLSIKALRECSCLVTISTHQLDLLQKYNSHYTVVETAGFSLLDIDKYITQYFDSSTAGESLITKVHSAPIIDTLAKFPIMLQLLCLIWELDNTLPRQTAKLYRRALKMLTNHISKSGDSIEQNPEKIDEFIKEIGDVAAKDVRKEGFSPDDFPEDALQFGLKIGILCKETVTKAEETACEVKFLRLSQEYSGAYFLAVQGDEGVKQQLLPQVTLESLTQQKMKFLLQFCCGLMKGSAASLIIKHVKRLSTEVAVQEFAKVLVSEAALAED